jgi:hypothetical protein
MKTEKLNRKKKKKIPPYPSPSIHMFEIHHGVTKRCIRTATVQATNNANDETYGIKYGPDFNRVTFHS